MVEEYLEDLLFTIGKMEEDLGRVDEDSKENCPEEEGLQRRLPPKVDGIQNPIRILVDLEGNVPLTFLFGFDLFLNFVSCCRDVDGILFTSASAFAFRFAG